VVRESKITENQSRDINRNLITTNHHHLTTAPTIITETKPRRHQIRTPPTPPQLNQVSGRTTHLTTSPHHHLITFTQLHLSTKPIKLSPAAPPSSPQKHSITKTHITEPHHGSRFTRINRRPNITTTTISPPQHLQTPHHHL
jgi:hypothetical protein